MELIEIYDAEASYSYSLRAPDRRHPKLGRDADDVHPWYCIHLFNPELAGNDDPGENGVGYALIPQAQLETMAAWGGFGCDEVEAIVDTLLHLPRGLQSDPLAATDPGMRRLRRALATLPDPHDPSLSRKRRRQAFLDQAAATKDIHRQVVHAPREARQGALDYRSAVISEWEAKLAEVGEELPPAYQLGRDEIAPEHPLAPILDGGPLDGRRVAARIARDEYLSLRAETAAEREAVDLRAPMTFAFQRSMPDVAALSQLVDDVRIELNAAKVRGDTALEAARTKRRTSAS
jgi:hypothetical protein